MLNKMATDFFGTFILLFIGCCAITMCTLYPEIVTINSSNSNRIWCGDCGYDTHFEHTSGARYPSSSCHVPFCLATQIIGACVVALLSCLLPGVADYDMTHAKL